MAKTQRLDKVLSNMGYGTRKEIRIVVKKGLVKVDGVVVKDSGQHVDPDNNIVEINGEKIQYIEYVYIMMNKPQGVLSASFDKKAKTVVDLLEEKYQKFKPFPAGRLDKDTEGLLVLTNDGVLAHEILAPKKHVPKKYYAKVNGKVSKEDIVAFQQGVILEDGYKTLPSQLEIIKSGEISEITLVIYEGKFHQVKRMFLSVGKEVVYLKRLSMGNLHLDDSLNPGEYRIISELEIKQLKMSKGEAF